jgi:DNA-binding response OmpR family regulator
MRAFVIEDDPDFRNLLADVLESVGWTVDLAEDGIAALGCIHRAIPDLITLDLSMPNLDGLQVLKLLRSTETGRRIPVVVITGVTADDSVRELASLVLVKPLDFAGMMQAIRTLTNASVEGFYDAAALTY